MSPWKVHETLYRIDEYYVKYSVLTASRATVTQVPDTECWFKQNSSQANMYKNNAEAIADVGNSIQRINYGHYVDDIDHNEILKEVLQVLQNHGVCTT